MSTTDDFQKKKFAFDIYDINKDGMISNGELFTVMKMMVGNNLNDVQVYFLCVIFFIFTFIIEKRQL